MIPQRLWNVLFIILFLLSASTVAFGSVGSQGAAMIQNERNAVKQIKVLIAYLSKYGSTKQYAEWIHEETKGDLVNIETEEKQDFAGYDIVIIGGYVRAGKIVCAPFIKDHWRAMKGKKVVLFTTSGTPPNHPKLQGIYEKSLPLEIRKEIKYFPLTGRLSGKELTRFDKFLIAIGKFLERDEPLKKEMGKDFNGVKRENLLPLFEYLEDVKTRLTGKND